MVRQQVKHRTTLALLILFLLQPQCGRQKSGVLGRGTGGNFSGLGDDGNNFNGDDDFLDNLGKGKAGGDNGIISHDDWDDNQLGDITNIGLRKLYPQGIPYTPGPFKLRFRQTPAGNEIFNMKCAVFNVDVMDSQSHNIPVPNGSDNLVVFLSDDGSLSEEAPNVGVFFEDTSCTKPLAKPLTYKAGESTKQVGYFAALPTRAGNARVLQARGSYKGNNKIIGLYAIIIKLNPKFSLPLCINLEDLPLGSGDGDFNDVVIRTVADGNGAQAPLAMDQSGTILAFLPAKVSFRLTGTSGCKNPTDVVLKDKDGKVKNTYTAEDPRTSPTISFEVGMLDTVQFVFRSTCPIGTVRSPHQQIRLSQTCRSASDEGHAW